MNCTFIGLGNMGRELCSQIGSAGFHTFAYDLNPVASKYAEENYENVYQADLLEAVQQSKIILTCLPNSHLVREIKDQLIGEDGALVKVQ